MIKDIETKFQKIADISVDLSKYPLTKEDKGTQVSTDKDKSDEFGEVFTPLWIVDNMIEHISDDKWADQTQTTLDLCAGYGQFTMRMMRKKYSLLGDKFDMEKFLTDTHSFCELQLSSCFKLLQIFGKDINLFIGDARFLPQLDDDSKGVWYYDEDNSEWINLTDRIQGFFFTTEESFQIQLECALSSMWENKLKSFGMEW